MKSPYPWFGGKSRAAPLIWQAFGDVDNFVDPFFGSGAVLLGRPDVTGTETVNDADGFIANFWRSLAHDPEATARAADWPVSEVDLSARHLWLVGQRAAFTERLQVDPDFYDPKIAGWWVWGLCSWIGSGWCSGEGPWSSDGERWIDARKLPHSGRCGTHRTRAEQEALVSAPLASGADDHPRQHRPGRTSGHTARPASVGRKNPGRGSVARPSRTNAARTPRSGWYTLRTSAPYPRIIVAMAVRWASVIRKGCAVGGSGWARFALTRQTSPTAEPDRPHTPATTKAAHAAGSPPSRCPARRTHHAATTRPPANPRAASTSHRTRKARSAADDPPRSRPPTPPPRATRRRHRPRCSSPPPRRTHRGTADQGSRPSSRASRSPTRRARAASPRTRHGRGAGVRRAGRRRRGCLAPRCRGGGVVG